MKSMQVVFDNFSSMEKDFDMLKLINSRKFAKCAAVVGLMIAGSIAVAAPASANTGNCMMLDNPPASLLQNLTSFEQSQHNAKIVHCQQAKEQAERSADASNSDTDGANDAKL